MYFDYPARLLPVSSILFCTHKGRQINLSGKRHRHARTGHEMIYVDYGSMRVRFECTELQLRMGDCLFLPGGIWHLLESEAGLPFNYLNVMFRGKVPDILFEKCLPLDLYALRLVERMSREVVAKLPYAQEAALCSLNELVIHLLRQLTDPRPARPVAPAYLRRHHTQLVNRALDIIVRHYAEPLTLRQTCRAVGISESYLHALLKKETGLNFTRLLHEQRVKAAKHLLHDSATTLKNVAGIVGYSSSSYFFKIFKRIAGMTPAAYARSLGEPNKVN
ncbi:MAG: helix-turn-helix domain-containing protein [Kiritimatiellia bacterium]